MPSGLSKAFALSIEFSLFLPLLESSAEISRGSVRSIAIPTAGADAVTFLAALLCAANRVGTSERCGMSPREKPALSTVVVSRSKSVCVVFQDMPESCAAGEVAAGPPSGSVIWRVVVVVAA